MNDNELAYLESIHLLVELLDKFFASVCELDLVFNFHKVRREQTDARGAGDGWRGNVVAVADQAAEREGRPPSRTGRHGCRHMRTHVFIGPLICCSSRLYCYCCCYSRASPCAQIYSILDEIYLGGEIQETSKRVILERLEELNKLE